MTRRDADYYPTTPECVEVLRRWLLYDAPDELDLDGSWFLEPAAGYGAIVRGLQVDGTTSPAQWRAIELQAALAERLHPHCGWVACADALELRRWDRSDHSGVDTVQGRGGARNMVIVANPPFALLDAFVDRMLDYVERGAWAIVLTRGQWLDEEGIRDKARPNIRKRRLPSHQLRMCWRPKFKGGTGSPSATHCWNIWGPHYDGNTGTDLHWLERPQLDGRHGELVRDHRNFQPGAVAQEGLGL